ncbi:HAD family hydrolase [Octadecabacter sp. 1_MG-2023]|uniref:D-glycero-alpha-D-manno-heptose-1,7-bisphosphate 7-phosphatase n=1 Tax=unclassified Octadecabacter TaxID=196158 RepID=UPI001C09A118|nr:MULTISPECIES: HAD family hydrolase [unclassified Octadecabacter]MBU2994060.1 HAD family hydrolase [Octadecabacter sp. B2R22]MDO6736086.1 HAD family hydrolase [Octadecabacter sp. 1_MG-2023]
MKGAVFLDRDGTIIELVHHLNDPADVAVIPGAGRAIADLRTAGWRVVIITNQSVIGRGKLTEAGLDEVHAEMRRQLAPSGADVDGIYFCPLAPSIKDSTVIEDPMRKPGPGMLLAAAQDMQIDLAASFMVGDTVSDMLAGRNAGCATVLVRTGYGAAYDHDAGAIDHDVADLSAAAQVILSGSDR